MFYSATHNCLIYDLPIASTQAIKAIIPETRQLSNGGLNETVAVPLTLRNSQILRHLGHEAMSPIVAPGEYDYPSQYPKPREHQYISSAFKTLYPRNLDISDMRCVDCETEYLSPTGWVRMDRYKGGPVAQYDPETGQAQWVEPEEYLVSDCAWMVRFKTTKSFDQKLSPGHRMLYRNVATGKLEVDTAWNVAGHQLRLANGFRHTFITTFTPVGMPGFDLTDEQLRVQIAVIADGHFANKNTNWCVVRLKKERKKIRLRAHLRAASIAFSEDIPEYKGAEGFSVFRFAAPRKDKKFTAYYWSASLNQLKVIATEAVHWDGSVRKASASAFYSTEAESADFVQYAYTATGRTASLRWHTQAEYKPCARVHASCRSDMIAMNGNKGEGGKINPISIERTTDGKMYCFAVPSTFLVFRRNGNIFVSGNTGKTLASLWAADFLTVQNVVHKILIISPLSTLERVWATEIETNFYGRRTASVLYGTREQRLKALNKDVWAYIINFEGLKVGSKRVGRGLQLGELAKQIIARKDIDLVLIDEISAYKDGGTDRYKVLDGILHAKPDAWRWGLSGTPAPNAPTDAHAIARLIYGKEGKPESFQSFKMRTMNRVSEFKWVPRPGAEQAVFDLLQPAIRFTRKELGFPPLSYETRDIELSPKQKQAYEAMRKDLEIWTHDGRRIDAVNEAALRTKLIQIACGAVYGADHKVYDVDAKPRLEMLDDIIDEAGGKILVFAPLTSVINMIHSHIHKNVGCEIVNGTVGAGARNKIFARFKSDPRLRVLIADPRTMAHGLNLTEAQTICWFCPIDSLELYLQANARIDGPNSAGVVIHLSSTPVEREIYKRLQEKHSLQGAILDLLRAG